MEEYMMMPFVEEEMPIVVEFIEPVKVVEYKTMYAILPEQDYHNLNAAISAALGYSPESDTKIYNTPEPDVVDGFCVMPITVEVQEKFPQVKESLDLLDIMPTLTPSAYENE